ncbi:MAG TPA: hypothetical protein VEH50_07705 [Methylomirabilota bacterium]|nr:hypothetical protein [Methylomirabilota bacterium]
MSLGFNSNVSAGGIDYHVQTEARAGPDATLDTVVYVAGRVIHRVIASYQDLLDGGASRKDLRDRVERQHQEVVAQLESGQVRDAAPPAITALDLRLRNASSWLQGGNASIELGVVAADGKPVDGATVEALVESRAGVAVRRSGVTDVNGSAVLQFVLPSPMPEGAALVIRAASGGARAELHYKLKARPGTAG